MTEMNQEQRMEELLSIKDFLVKNIKEVYIVNNIIEMVFEMEYYESLNLQLNDLTQQKNEIPQRIEDLKQQQIQYSNEQRYRNEGNHRRITDSLLINGIGQPSNVLSQPRIDFTRQLSILRYKFNNLSDQQIDVENLLLRYNGTRG